MDNRPTPQIMESPPGAETLIDGRRYLYFGGTSYLGLAGRPEVIEAACEATRRFGVHTATSRAGFGTNPATVAVERLAAEFFGREEAFYFISGYVGSHVLVQSLAGRFDAVLIDESSHFSVREAARLAGGPIVPFRHRDPDDLQRQLRQHGSAGRRPLVMTDGVFPMTGAVAPVDEYLRVLDRCGTASLVIDDAHGIGVLGEHGRGTLEHFELWESGINAETSAAGTGRYVCGTLSKAMGGFGGIVPGSREFVQAARGASHYFDGASAPPSPAAGATAKAIEIVRREPQLRDQLRKNASHIRAGLRSLGLTVDEWPTPIIGLAVGNAENMRRIHRELKSAEILVPYFAAYSGTGPEGMLRIAVFATHTLEMLDRLLSELQRVV
jgi:7-keto-8-aminopelargonate synthetase-like enzyme